MTVYRCSTCGSWSEDLGFTCPRHGRAALTTVERRSSAPTGLRAGLRAALGRSREGWGGEVELPVSVGELTWLVRTGARNTFNQMFPPPTPAAVVRERAERLAEAAARWDAARANAQAAHGRALARIPATSRAPSAVGPWWPTEMW